MFALNLTAAVTGLQLGEPVHFASKLHPCIFFIRSLSLAVALFNFCGRQGC